MMNNDAKPRLIRRVLLLQEFDLETRDKKGSENVVGYLLSSLENSIVEDNDKEIVETFLDEQLMAMNILVPWYADFVNYLVCNVLTPELK